MSVLRSVKWKPLDLVLAVVLMATAFVPFFLLARPASASDVAQLKAFGKVVKTFPLDSDARYVYKHDGEENIVRVAGHRVRVTYANCPDKLDVKQGWISRPGQTIVCLPHAVVITIVASDGSEKPVKQDGKTVDYGG